MPRRHALNNCAAPKFTYEERRKLKIWGTQKRRLGADSARGHDTCGLCLTAATEPLACTKGHLFCKTCIYENLLAQKERMRAQEEAFARQEADAARAAEAESREAEAARAHMFQKLAEGVLPASKLALLADARRVASAEDVPAGYEATRTPQGILYTLPSAGEAARPASDVSSRPKLPSYWLPSLTPTGAREKVAPPPKHTTCPLGDHALRLRDLAPVHFVAPIEEAAEDAAAPAAAPAGPSSSAPPSSSSSSSSSAAAASASVSAPPDRDDARFMCPSCRRALTKAVRVTHLRSCGHVFCAACVAQLGDDAACALCGRAYDRSSDLVALASGGTGYSANGGTVAVSKALPAFQC